MRAHVRTLKVIYARTRMHISEKISAPISTKTFSVRATFTLLIIFLVKSLQK